MKLMTEHMPLQNVEISFIFSFDRHRTRVAQQVDAAGTAADVQLMLRCLLAAPASGLSSSAADRLFVRFEKDGTELQFELQAFDPTRLFDADAQLRAYYEKITARLQEAGLQQLLEFSEDALQPRLLVKIPSVTAESLFEYAMELQRLFEKFSASVHLFPSSVFLQKLFDATDRLLRQLPVQPSIKARQFSEKVATALLESEALSILLLNGFEPTFDDLPKLLSPVRASRDRNRL